MPWPHCSEASAVSSGRAIMVTGSYGTIAFATSAYARRAASMRSPHSSVRHGQAIQQRACGAHSAGMAKPCARGVVTGGLLVNSRS